MNADPPRLAMAAVLLALYVLLCLAAWRSHRRRSGASRPDDVDADAAGDPAVLIGYASQTGVAARIARDTAQALQARDRRVRLVTLDAITPHELGAAGTALLVTSTSGEGDAPDGAARFWLRCLDASAAESTALHGLHYGLLALGDSSYARFCGFGRDLDAELQRAGARPLFPRIDMDGASPRALQAWQQAVGEAAGLDAALHWGEEPFRDCAVLERKVLNEGSTGGRIVELALQPPPGADWQPGDLVEVRVPADPEQPRSYSVASIPRDGRLELLVRATRRPDGTPGVASHWLADTVRAGDAVAVRLRANPGFHPPEDPGPPVIFIGNGTGLAGLRAHLRARAATGGGPAWLIFGERHAASDFLCRSELEGRVRDGTLERLDMVFSRDQPQRIHVQHRLLEHAAQVRERLLRDGGAVYVCGSQQGMAGGVHEALRQAIGPRALARLQRDGRYRRDVY